MSDGDDWLDELGDAGDGREHSRDATLTGYRTAYGHARAIVDAATRSMIHGYWTAAKIPAERGPMIEAIARKMRPADRMIHPGVVDLAVDDILAGRPPRW